MRRKCRDAEPLDDRRNHEKRDYEQKKDTERPPQPLTKSLIRVSAKRPRPEPYPHSPGEKNCRQFENTMGQQPAEHREQTRLHAIRNHYPDQYAVYARRGSTGGKNPVHVNTAVRV